MGANDAIIFANRALGEIFALNPDTLVGEPLAALGKLFADPAFPELVDATQRGADSPPPREFAVTVGEARKIIAVAATPLQNQDDGASGALLVIADNTRERELANHLKQAERLAALGQLAAGIAHEIRNPLNLIRGFAQLIQRKAPDDEVIAGNSGIIVQEVDRLNDLVQGMLDLARQEKLDRQPVKLHDQLDRVINMFCEDDTYAMPVELDEGDHAVAALLDDRKMTGVWLNLLRNAGDAMQGRPGGIRLSYGVDPEDARRVFVSISDAGCGIPEAELKLLFTPFHTTKTSGTGLGLAITHKLVEAHGGLISVASEVARGTTFTVKLPRA